MYCLRPMVRSFSASSSLVTAMRVMLISIGMTGSTDSAKHICMGPRTWPQLTPVVITAPKLRMSKKLSHMNFVTFSRSCSPFGSFFSEGFIS